MSRTELLSQDCTCILVDTFDTWVGSKLTQGLKLLRTGWEKDWTFVGSSRYIQPTATGRQGLTNCCWRTGMVNARPFKLILPPQKKTLGTQVLDRKGIKNNQTLGDFDRKIVGFLKYPPRVRCCCGHWMTVSMLSFLRKKLGKLQVGKNLTAKPTTVQNRGKTNLNSIFCQPIYIALNVGTWTNRVEYSKDSSDAKIGTKENCSELTKGFTPCMVRLGTIVSNGSASSMPFCSLKMINMEHMHPAASTIFWSLP